VQAARASFATAYFDEQRRKQAEARVPFLLVSFLWARKEKTLAYRRNKMLKQSTQPSKETPITTSQQIQQQFELQQMSFTKIKKATEVAFFRFC
jgi:hypothetical protein